MKFKAGSEEEGGCRRGRRTEDNLFMLEVNWDGENEEGGDTCGISGYGESI